ncbi:acid-sensing ion channel 1C-like [Gigantopelta aegis]|uniref:acid-sensing ion channel 1C-like n=1 Tax=Gigantopelta aegis TaxID=1735272 RepID=UPI001B888D42|nr:acid-sensing ion channel 1C-like [Gigantopelta aegis]
MTINGLPEKAAFDTPDIRYTKSKPPVRWAHAWTDFTQQTTFHGLKYIWMDGAFVFRRLLWFLVVVSCMCVMCYQIIDRIIYYNDFPVTVNVQVNFNTSLSFPSVTLCNQNSFRATAATSEKRYRLIEEMFSKGHNFNISVLDSFNATAVTLDDLYTSAAHRKEDLIVSCKWQGEVCGPQNFTEILTDHGVCYTFNSKRLHVSSTGSDYGLKLTLNVEQYEYMPGPHDAAGVKLLLHDHKEFPKVHELGLAIPTGSHTFIGIQLVSIVNLEKPHGDCGSETSPYYSVYSTDSCQLVCAVKYMTEECGCRHHFMPHIEGQPPICTLEQFYSCYEKRIKSSDVPMIDHSVDDFPMIDYN